MSTRTPESTPQTPPVVCRAVWLWAVASTAFALAAIAWVILREPLGLPRGGVYRFMPLSLALTPILVFLPLWHWRVRRLRRALFASRFRLCTRCEYDLSTLSTAGTCPECGRPYEASRDVAMWASTGAPYTEPRPAGFTPWSPPGDDDPLSRKA